MNPRLRQTIQVLILVGLALWIYQPAFRGGFVWDDSGEILRNTPIQGPAHGILAMWVSPTSDDYFPLKETVQWCEWHLWGADPLGYHLVNLALHLASVFLFWGLLVKLRVRFAWWAALGLVVHPMIVESVAWISELKNTLSLPFLLGSCLAYATFDQAPAGKPRRGLYVASVLLFLAAMCAKSSVVMLPCVLVVYEVWRREKPRLRDFVRTVPFFVISGVMGLVTVWFQEHRAIRGVTEPIGGAWDRWVGAGHALLFYIGKSLIPWPVGPVYRAWPTGASFAAELTPWLVLLVLLAGVIWISTRWKRRGALVAAAWFFLNLLPVVGFVRMSFARIGPVSDHFAYISLLGLLGGLAAAAGELLAVLTTRTWRGRLAGLAVSILMFWAVASHRVASIYRSDEAFWTYACNENPGSWVAQSNLGMIDLNAGRLQSAAERFQRVLNSGARQAELFNNLGTAYTRLGRYADAIPQFEQAIALQPGYPVAEANLGNVLAQTRDYAGAAEHYQRSLALVPDAADVRIRLARVEILLGRSSEAASECAEASRLDPSLAEPHYLLGNLLANQGQLAEALSQYRAAVGLNPRYAEAYAAIGLALTLQQRPSEALEPLSRAIAANPNSASAYAYLGFALFRLGRYSDAVHAYHDALRIGGENPDLLYNLADALKASGHPEDALAAAREAERLQRSP